MTYSTFHLKLNLTFTISLFHLCLTRVLVQSSRLFTHRVASSIITMPRRVRSLSNRSTSLHVDSAEPQLKTRFQLLTYALYALFILFPSRSPVPRLPSSRLMQFMRHKYEEVVILTYSSRVPPGQLPLLGVYAYSLVYLSEKGWIDPSKFGKAGASLLGVLSMGEESSLSNPYRDRVTQ